VSLWRLWRPAICLATRSRKGRTARNAFVSNLWWRSAPGRGVNVMTGTGSRGQRSATITRVCIESTNGFELEERRRFIAGEIYTLPELPDAQRECLLRSSSRCEGSVPSLWAELRQHVRDSTHNDSAIVGKAASICTNQLQRSVVRQETSRGIKFFDVKARLDSAVLFPRNFVDFVSYLGATDWAVESLFPPAGLAARMRRSGANVFLVARFRDRNLAWLHR
jgi:hypothetical protein